MITFTGGLILGLVIGAVVVFALALYILWSPVRELRESCREAETENERVRLANLDVMMHFDDMKAAKDNAEERVKELAQFIGAGDRLCYELESWLATEHDKETQRAINIWKRLRRTGDKHRPEQAQAQGGE